MIRFRDLSIRRKLMVLTIVTTSSALLLASSAFLTHELVTYRESMVQELQTLANVIGDNTTAALTFGDARAAEELLGSLRAQPHIMSAAVFDRQGALFARYHRTDAGDLVIPSLTMHDGHAFGADDVQLSRPILLAGESIGTVYIRSDLEQMNARIYRYALIIVGVLLVSLFAALTLSARLQRNIAGPLTHLAETAKSVSEGKNYELRAEAGANDEIGFLIKEFNSMLSQIHARDAELQKAHDELEARVAERTKALEQEVIERRKVDEKNREQATLIDQTQDAIYVTDFDDVVRLWNRSASLLYGWTEQEAIGRRSSELVLSEQPAANVISTVRTKGEWRGDVVQHRKDGSELHVESRLTLLRDSAGGPKAILAVNTDITEKKRIEAQFLRAQRMESIGTLAGGIAHDINNVLSPILMSVGLMRKRTEDEQLQKTFNLVELSAKRGADLVKQVLTFARGIEGQRKPLKPLRVVQEMEKIVQETFPRTISIRTEVAPDIWAFLGDATQVHQVLLNLCVNARDAIASEGTITIDARNQSLSSAQAKLHVGATPGPYVVLSVSDTGSGIPPEVIDRVFEPFFTTKEAGKGTGLGLSTVLAIVKSHGGFLNIYSEPGRGTSIKAYFPAVRSASEIPFEDYVPDEVRGKGETILLVDDELSIREITRDTLETFGYAVLTADDGAQAMPIFERHRADIRLVLTDIMMPNMDGPATVRALRKIDRNLKIIVASGMADKARILELEAMGIHAFLSKPYTANELLEILHKTLHGRTPQPATS